jgi:hypothetical protein
MGPDRFPDFMVNKLYAGQTERSLNEKTRHECRAATLSYEQRAALADDLQVDRLRSLAAAIRLGVEGNLLVFREAAQAGSLYGRDMHEDVSATVLGFDEAKALIGVKEFYSASFGHASGPFLSTRSAGGITVLPKWAWGRQFSTIEERVLLSRPDIGRFAKTSLPTSRRPEWLASPARFYFKIFPCSQIARTE